MSLKQKFEQYEQHTEDLINITQQEYSYISSYYAFALIIKTSLIFSAQIELVDVFGKFINKIN